MNKKLLFTLAVIIGLSIGFGLGYSSGTYATLGFAVEKAQVYLDAEGVNISLKKEVLLGDIFKYKNEIGGCDAFIPDDQRN